MTAKEYLKQAWSLNQKINDDLEEAGELRKMIASVSSPGLGERVQMSRSGEAPFVRHTEKIIELEDKINREIDCLVDLKEEIRGVIDALDDRDEAMVLRRRYLLCYSWERIAQSRGVNIRTVQRWHTTALRHVVLPEDSRKI